MHLTHIMTLQQEDLKRVNKLNYFNEQNPCHIYFICKRHRVIVDPSGFSVNDMDNTVNFKFKIQKQETFEDLIITVQNGFGTKNLKIVSNYPFNSFELFANNKIFWHGKSAVLLQQLQNLIPGYSEHLDLEILYIGQSYGVEGARTAPDRLQSHSTLQSIYSEAIQRNPDCEIWLALTSFEQILLTTFDGRVKVSEEKMSIDDEHIKSVTKTILNAGLNEQQVINFTEAALIRHFAPPYNIEYKETFPNPAHKTYKQCYDLDINSVCIEVGTETIYCRLFSDKVEKDWRHFRDFPLHSREDRKSMFDF